MTQVDLRCPVTPRRLFARLHVDPQVRIVPGNLVEVDCRDCRKAVGATRVLHLFNALGEHVETVVE